VNVLAFFAHPDDETMLAGGILALLSRGGAQVHYLCATRGEGGEVGEPPVCEPAAATITEESRKTFVILIYLLQENSLFPRQNSFVDI